MLSIVLTILKITGVLLLAVLGMVLLLLLLVLLVPLRWQGRGSWEEKPDGMLNITWLFHLLSVQLSYQETFEWSVRLFGISVWKSEEEEEREQMLSEPEVSKSRTHSDSNPLKTIQAEEQWDEIDRSRKQAEEDLQDSDFEVSIQERSETVKKHPVKKKEVWKKTLSSVLRSVKAAFQRRMETLREFRRFIEKATECLGEEANQKTFRLLKRQLSRLLTHLLPRTIQGNVTFGLEDPYVMGQILSAAALFYPLYAKQVTVVPVFDEAVFQGNLQMKGRVRIGTLLCLTGRLLLHKNFRTLVKKILNRGGKKDGR